LIVSDGQRERELLLVGTIVVGRDPACDVSEDGDSLLSRRHTEFVAGPDGVVVRDLGSRNGTFVNGVKVAEGPIRPGDIVHIGHLRLRYVEGDEPAAAARPAARAAGAIAAASPSEDEEVTRIIQAVRPVPPAQATVPVAADEDDRTVVTPRPGAAPGPAPVSTGSPVASDDERTVFVTSGSGVRVSAPGPSSRPMPPAPDATSAARPGPVPSEIGTFVSVQVFGVAAMAFLAAIVGVFLGRSELFAEGASAGAFLKWLAAPIAIAVLSAWRASRLITRRIGRTLTTDNEEGLRV
jgi:predicted component of type VI protein secretion system